MVTWTSLNDTDYEVFLDGVSVGQIKTHSNPFHGRNCYLKLELSRLDFDASELFDGLYAQRQRPLHTMLPHNEQALAGFLRTGGFRLRRRCFPMRVKKEELLKPIAAAALTEFVSGQPEYETACHLLYDQYARDHAPISPLTADFEVFCSALPSQVVCSMADGTIRQYAFLDQNEVAYMGSEALSGFPAFAGAVLARLFEAYDEVVFEADDIDRVAMVMRSFFTDGDGFSLDTYLFDASAPLLDPL